MILFIYLSQLLLDPPHFHTLLDKHSKHGPWEVPYTPVEGHIPKSLQTAQTVFKLECGIPATEKEAKAEAFISIFSMVPEDSVESLQWLSDVSPHDQASSALDSFVFSTHPKPAELPSSQSYPNTHLDNMAPKLCVSKVLS